MERLIYVIASIVAAAGASCATHSATVVPWPDPALIESYDEGIDRPSDEECQKAWERSVALWHEAIRCTKDTDCFPYACNCSALANNDAMREYIAFTNMIGVRCGWSICEGKCPRTKAACFKGTCGVHILPERPAPLEIF